MCFLVVDIVQTSDGVVRYHQSWREGTERASLGISPHDHPIYMIYAPYSHRKTTITNMS